MTLKIVVVHDSDPIANALVSRCESAGYDVIAVKSEQPIVEIIKSYEPDVVVIDWMLNAVVDTDLCRQIRSEELARTPFILLLTECSTEASVLRGFEAGADDYAIKPFSMELLLARIKALIRHQDTHRSLRPGVSNPLIADREAHRVSRGDREIRLSPTEFKILEFLIERRGRLVTRAQLIEHVWAEGASDVQERTVDVHITRIRRAIAQPPETDPIRTVRDAGYIFEE